MGIEPTQSAWKAEILPLNYTRSYQCDFNIISAYFCFVKGFLTFFKKIFQIYAANSKPGSVVDGHLSGIYVAAYLKPPSQEMSGKLSLLVRCCSGWGLQHPLVTKGVGELLPRLFTLTCSCRRYLSVALSLKSPPQAVSLHPALWSPDFPHIRNHFLYAQPSCLLHIIYKSVTFITSGLAAISSASDCSHLPATSIIVYALSPLLLLSIFSIFTPLLAKTSVIFLIILGIFL